jgi:hypothetical protein
MKALPPQKQAALVHAAMRIWPRSFTGYPSALTDAQVFARTEVKAQSIREGSVKHEDSDCFDTDLSGPTNAEVCADWSLMCSYFNSTAAVFALRAIRAFTPSGPHIPHATERSALQRMSAGQPSPLNELYPAGRTVAGMLAKGWIESELGFHGVRYQITPFGKAALRVPTQR